MIPDASVSLSPDSSDFPHPIKPVQNFVIKGITAGLKVAGIHNISYTITMYNGDTHRIILKHYLYVPQCAVCWLCLRQIGANTGHLEDGYNALSDKSILTINGAQKALTNDKISQLPLLFTSPSIATFQRCSCNMSNMLSSPP